MDEEIRKIFLEIKSRLIDLERQPKPEHYYTVSKDGKYLIHGTKFVDIKPIEGYMDKVLENKPKSSLNNVTEERVD